VWCWNDLWRAVREATDDGPVLLSESGYRAVLIEAIARARGAGELPATAAVAAWPGFRRRLRGRIAGWTRLERPPEAEPPGGGPAVADEWAVFGHYRRLLGGLDAEDAEGFAAWASRALEHTTPTALRPSGSLPVTVLDLDDEPPAVRRVLHWLEAKAKSVRVALAFDTEPAQREVYAAVAPIRQRLLARGYREELVPPGFYRPQGLRDLERRLFRADGHTLRPLTDVRGLTVLGAPQGDGVGLVVAREVKRRLGAGVAPEDVLVLVRRWDDDAEAVLEVLRSWGLPVSAPSRPRPLAREPAVSALRLALEIPARGWEAADVVCLLRHGRFRPDWAEVCSPALPARAASAVQASPVFRGHDALMRALDRALDEANDDRARKTAIEVRALVERLVREVDPVDRPGTRRAHLERVRRLNAALGFDRAGRDDALELFLAAFDDHAAVRDALAQDDEPLDLAAFAREVDGLAHDLVVEGEPVAPGTVVMTTVDAATGARAGHVFLVNLVEGTFPTRDAVDLSAAADPVVEADDETAPAARADRAFGREMARFLRVIGSADASLVLAYPTRDEKGQEVLPAGFLDDVVRSFDRAALAPAHEEHVRFDPTLIDWPELAQSPADARVRAVALACAKHDAGTLQTLAADAAHRPILLGAAQALDLARWRFHEKTFTRFDGLLTDPAAVAAIARRFGPDRPFSASQLESYLYCPFQFFMKYVLELVPVDDRDELDEDYVERGDRVHKMLERFETLRQQGRDDLLEVTGIVLRDEMRAELTVESDIDPARQAIEQRRMERILRNYVAQARGYEQGEGPAPQPRHLEVSFGDSKRDDRFPCLGIGEGPSAVKVRGKIDRVDVLVAADGLEYRVIDYKTGPCPSAAEVRSLDMLQLPLYALAVERLLLREEGAVYRDVGYWELRNRGYLPVTKIEWEAFRDALEAQVIETVGRLRRGRFVIKPRCDDCTSHCDFRAVCRIGQARNVAKREPDEGGSDAT
jgi:ATP-dependent helicase/nuclease subunit B